MKELAWRQQPAPIRDVLIDARARDVVFAMCRALRHAKGKQAA